YACPACVLWSTFPARRFPHACRTRRFGCNASLAAGRQRAHACGRTRAHRSFGSRASRGKQRCPSCAISQVPETFRRTQASRVGGLAGESTVTKTPALRGSPDLGVTVAGIHLKNPVIAASGTFGYGLEFEDVVHLDRLGGFVVKGLSREPM